MTHTRLVPSGCLLLESRGSPLLNWSRWGTAPNTADPRLAPHTSFHIRLITNFGWHLP